MSAQIPEVRRHGTIDEFLIERKEQAPPDGANNEDRHQQPEQDAPAWAWTVHERSVAPTNDVREAHE
jgi:hypothetical protein